MSVCATSVYFEGKLKDKKAATSKMFFFRINVDPLCVGMRMVKGLLAGDNSVAVAAFSTFNFPSK